MINYIINQQGQVLTSSTSIKLVKYENKVSRLVFNFDGTIPEELRLYCAFLNPKTKKYFYEPIINSSSGSYITIGTEITYYPSRWEMLLIGISPDRNIDSTTEINDDLIVWSSYTFKKIVVVDTFLNDDAVMVTHPNIEKALDDLMVLHDDVVEYSALIGDDMTRSELILDQCNNIIENIQNIYSNITAIEQNLIEKEMSLTTMYDNYMYQMNAAYQTYINDINQEREGG